MIRLCKSALIIVIFLIGPSACEVCSDTKKYFNISEIDIYHMEFNAQGLNPWERLPAGDTVQWKDFFMRIAFQKTYYSQVRSSAGSNLFADCFPMGYMGSKSGIDTLYLVALTDYNDAYSDNDTLNNILLTNHWTYTVDDFERFISVGDYIRQNTPNIKHDSFELKLSQSPSKDYGEYVFRLIYILNTGETFISDSEAVRLKK